MFIYFITQYQSFLKRRRLKRGRVLILTEAGRPHRYILRQLIRHRFAYMQAGLNIWFQRPIKAFKAN